MRARPKRRRCSCLDHQLGRKKEYGGMCFVRRLTEKEGRKERDSEIREQAETYKVNRRRKVRCEFEKSGKARGNRTKHA